MKNWKKEIFTIPNLLSLFRLLLIPVYITIYTNAQENTDYFLAAAILAVSCLTDGWSLWTFRSQSEQLSCPDLTESAYTYRSSSLSFFHFY